MRSGGARDLSRGTCERSRGTCKLTGGTCKESGGTCNESGGAWVLWIIRRLRGTSKESETPPCCIRKPCASQKSERKSELRFVSVSVRGLRCAYFEDTCGGKLS